jgi:hypothetical protein
MWALGTRVDASGALLTAIGATAPDDALIVHDAVLALGDMWIEQDAGDGSVAVWTKAEIAEAGWRLHRTARGWMIARPDAREIALVRDVPVTQSVVTTLLIEHARSGGRPEVYAGWQRPRGRPSSASAVAYADVLWHRSVYCVWREALDVLAGELEGALAGWAVIGPEAPEEPWACQPRRVLTGSGEAKA